MLQSDAVIRSKCHHCGELITVQLTASGSQLDEALPASTVVWAGSDRNGSCSATSLCTVLAFFCSSEHLEQGVELPLGQDLQVSQALFRPMLALAVSEVIEANA